MTKQVYSTKSAVWKLYKRIEDATKKQLNTGHYYIPGSDPSIDDIVIEGNGIKLVGKNGYSSLVYKRYPLVYKWYPGKDWVVAEFEPEQKVPIEKREYLLELLRNHYGEPTLRDNNKLLYQIVIGKRKILDIFYDGTTDEKTEDIIRTLILEINPFSFLSE